MARILVWKPFEWLLHRNVKENPYKFPIIYRPFNLNLDTWSNAPSWLVRTFWESSPSPKHDLGIYLVKRAPTAQLELIWSLFSFKLNATCHPFNGPLYTPHYWWILHTPVFAGTASNTLMEWSCYNMSNNQSWSISDPKKRSKRTIAPLPPNWCQKWDAQPFCRPLSQLFCQLQAQSWHLNGFFSLPDNLSVTIQAVFLSSFGEDIIRHMTRNHFQPSNQSH